MVVLRVLPFALIIGWATWALAVSRRVRPRLLAIILVLLGAGPAVWSCAIALEAHRSYASDQATARQWEMQFAEDAATRSAESP